MLILVACVMLASGCAMQAQNGSEDQAAKTDKTMTDSNGSTGAQGGTTGVGGAGFSEQTMTDSGDTGAMQVESMTRIYFEFDSYALKPEARETLSDNAAYLKAHPNTTIRIEGHCDERGSDEYNLALGERRARAAKSYLQTLGVDTSRMTIISYGEERPLDPSNTEAAWAVNRRAEFVER